MIRKAVKIMARKAMGTQIAYSDSGNEKIGLMTSVGGINLTADSLEVTNHDNAEGFRQFIQGLRDGGSVDIEGQFSAGDSGQIAVIDHYNQDDDGGIRELTVSFPDGSAWTFDAIVTALSIPGDAPVDGVLTFSATFKITGTPEFSEAGS